MMDELLTTRQVQDLLQVDRITIYRMLKDGRLNGVKVGGQWRFPRAGIDDFIYGTPKDETPRPPTEILPLHCLQVIQDVFADIIRVGSITTAPDGQPITEISNSCSFCNLILSSPSGREGCVASWRRLAQTSDGAPSFTRCHAGLQYARGTIEIEGQLIAILVAGQFYLGEVDQEEQNTRIEDLASSYQLDPEALKAAAGDIRRLGLHTQDQIGEWLVKVAHTFEDIGRERADLITRLNQIAAMSTLEPVES